MESVFTILISGGVSVAVTYAVSLLNRKKTTAETEGLVVDQFSKFSQAQNTRIEALEKKNEEQERENEECAYRSKVLELQVRRLNKIVSLRGYSWEKVFVLDDNATVTKLFKKQFERASIHMAAFNDHIAFLEAVKVEQPEIVVLDHWLGNIVAKDIIAQMDEYRPEIILMSADKDLAEEYENIGIKFFWKDPFYIFKIAGAVVEYLIDKLK
jgi:CheY-like chemotaxis protein